MISLISITLILIILLVYNQVYFFLYKEKVVFFKYLKNFIIYSLIIFMLAYIFANELFFAIDQDFLQSIFSTYVIMFLVLFFNISTKSYESPTVLIYNLIKKNGYSYNNILKSLKKKRLVKIRIQDLLKQKLLIKNKDKLTLSSLGIKFSRFYLFLKNFYKIKSQG